MKDAGPLLGAHGWNGASLIPACACVKTSDVNTPKRAPGLPDLDSRGEVRLACLSADVQGRP